MKWLAAFIVSLFIVSLAFATSAIAQTTINVANAPGWVADNLYSAGDRVIAGPGWTPGSPGSYTSYSLLYEWGTVTGGTSSPSQPGGFATCAAPAGYGGAIATPTIAPPQWAAATHVTDNGVTWVCLTAVDNVTESDMNIDSPIYQNGGSYFNGQYVTFDNTTYVNTKTPLTTAPFTCTTNTTSPLTDTGCTWSAVGTILYSAGVNYWPHQAYAMGTSTGSYSQLTGPVTIIFWYGGLGTRQSYQAGANGETKPLTVSYHYDFQGFDDQPLGPIYPFTMNVAPGDSARDNLTVGTGPLRSDPTKGVNFFADGVFIGPDNGVAFAPSDSAGRVSRFQIQSVNGSAVEGQFGAGNNSGHSNGVTMVDDIIDSGGTSAGPDHGISPDGSWIIHDSLIICRAPFAGGVCIESKYGSLNYDNTIIGPGCDSAADITAFSEFANQADYSQFYNNAIFGFCHTFAVANTQQITTAIGATNAIDGATNAAGTSFLGPNGRVTFFTVEIPVSSTCGLSNTSSCAGLNIANQFVNPTLGSSLDLRLNTSPLADVVGAGANFSGSFYSVPISGPENDFLDQSRASRVDVGAVNAASASPLISSGWHKW